MLKRLCELAAVADQVKFTLLSLDAGQFMVVIETSAELAKEFPALAAPLQIVESADNLEAEVLTALAQYVPAITERRSNVKEVLAAVEAERIAAEEKKKASTLAKSTSSTSKATKPAATSKSPADAATPPPPGLGDLFSSAKSVKLFQGAELGTLGSEKSLDALETTT